MGKPGQPGLGVKASRVSADFPFIDQRYQQRGFNPLAVFLPPPVGIGWKLLDIVDQDRLGIVVVVYGISFQALLNQVVEKDLVEPTAPHSFDLVVRVDDQNRAANCGCQAECSLPDDRKEFGLVKVLAELFAGGNQALHHPVRLAAQLKSPQAFCRNSQLVADQVQQVAVVFAPGDRRSGNFDLAQDVVMSVDR